MCIQIHDFCKIILKVKIPSEIQIFRRNTEILDSKIT